MAGLDDLELLAIFQSLPRSSARRAAACEVLVARHAGLVRSCALRYRRDGEPAGDLMQVGYLGLLRAMTASTRPPASAWAPTRRSLDKTWPVHVARPAQELALEVRAATEQLSQDLGRDPAEPDLASWRNCEPPTERRWPCCPARWTRRWAETAMPAR